MSWRIKISSLLITAAALLLFTSFFQPVQKDQPFLVVLGIAQDAGYPQAGCKKDCCKRTFEKPALKRMVCSLGLVDPQSGQRWIFDATPDFTQQLHKLDELAPPKEMPGIEGILLTHGHIGHYTGLMYLGRAAIGAKNVKVYAMPRMKSFLENNGPWSQLVGMRNIDIQPIESEKPIQLNDRLTVTPLLVPHRDEYTETVGYKIKGPAGTALFIPDIDKWEKWEWNIFQLIKEVDVAFLDGSFFQNGELPGRDMSEIPHPFIEESMQYFSKLPAEDRKKIHFIHFNHTNPVLIDQSEAQKQVKEKGYSLASEGQVIKL